MDKKIMTFQQFCLDLTNSIELQDRKKRHKKENVSHTVSVGNIRLLTNLLTDKTIQNDN